MTCHVHTLARIAVPACPVAAAVDHALDGFDEWGKGRRRFTIRFGFGVRGINARDSFGTIRSGAQSPFAFLPPDPSDGVNLEQGPGLGDM